MPTMPSRPSSRWPKAKTATSAITPIAHSMPITSSPMPAARQWMVAKAVRTAWLAMFSPPHRTNNRKGVMRSSVRAGRLPRSAGGVVRFGSSAVAKNTPNRQATIVQMMRPSPRPVRAAPMPTELAMKATDPHSRIRP